MDFTELTIKASNLLSTVENYQWTLGQISNEVVSRYGYKALEEFSKEIEENSGVKRSPATLRMYAYIWKVSKKLKLPKDLLFSTCQTIVFSNNPVKYSKMAQLGSSRAEIKQAIYEDKD